MERFSDGVPVCGGVGGRVDFPQFGFSEVRRGGGRGDFRGSAKDPGGSAGSGESGDGEPAGLVAWHAAGGVPRPADLGGVNMPLYDFECVGCNQQEEHFCEVVERDHVEFACSRCGKKLRRVVSAPAYHGEPYQMGVVLSDGTRVKGHFGKEAQLLKRAGR